MAMLDTSPHSPAFAADKVVATAPDAATGYKPVSYTHLTLPTKRIV
mgnify:CR=1 FL=1